MQALESRVFVQELFTDCRQVARPERPTQALASQTKGRKQSPTSARRLRPQQVIAEILGYSA